MRYTFCVICLSLVLALSLFLFSYTQVDLGLTLSQQSIARDIQSFFQQIGFYNRPLALVWYIVNIVLAVSVFIGTVFVVVKQKITLKQLLFQFFVLTVPLFFSYPAAFSYDIFNYIFTAKTILVYGENPYTVIPLQFAGIDAMLGFMRWTHLPSAYTPVWIFITLPLYALSFNFLFLGLFSLKIAAVVSYFISLRMIYVIQRKESMVNRMLSLVLFGANPLIIIESFVSGHNDMVMMMFALISFYLYINKNKTAAFFAFSMSVATKLMTLPLIILFFIPWKKSRAVILLSAGLAAVLTQRELLPWYFVWLIPFTALLPHLRWLQIVVFSLSVGLMAKYAPVIYMGTFNQPVPMTQTIIVLLSLAAGIGLSIVDSKLLAHRRDSSR